MTGRLAGIGRRLDFAAVAEDIIEAVVEVTDFQVGTLTVREGNRCRRVATAGLGDGRVGMTTPFEYWSVLLREEWRRGAHTYLIPPEAPARWADDPDIPPSDDPNAWTAEHGLIVLLLDYADEIIGFLGVDVPRSGLLPDDATIERLEAFAREAQAAFVNARLYAIAQRQAETTAQLLDVAKTMAATTDLDQVVPQIMQAMENRYGTHEVGVGRLHGTVLELRRMAGGRLETSEVELAGVVLELADELNASGMVMVNNVAERPALSEWLAPESRALLAVGAHDDVRTVMLIVASETEAAFDAEDAQFLQGLLDITVVAMRNADLYEEVRAAAERDPLTGVRNRRMLPTIVGDMLAAVSPDAPLSLVVVDIDNFKQLNDTHGHDVGDRALQHVAARLQAGVRETDAVFRVGGEEFVVAVAGTDAAEAVVAMERIRETVQTTRLDLPVVTVSAGVATTDDPSVDVDTLFAMADTALYRAKRMGKDAVAVADHHSGGLSSTRS